MPFAYEQALDDWRATCACAQRQSLPTHRLAARSKALERFLALVGS